MKKDSWIIYAIVTLTSSTTVLTLLDGTLLGFLRGLLFAAILDGSVIYWEGKGETLKDTKQRKWAVGMKWSAVGMLLIIALSFVAILLVPVDAPQPVDLFGMSFMSTMREVIHWGIFAMIGSWVVLTLGVVLRLREIDPDTVRERERKQTVDEMEKERADKEDEAYRTAMKAIAEMTGYERGIAAFEARLKADGAYTPHEIEQLVGIARTKLTEAKTGATPVDAQNPFANRYPSQVKDETTSFTRPSTPPN